MLTDVSTTPETGQEAGADAHLYVTLSDQNENVILELVRVDESGMYIRSKGEWTPIDPDADNERVWDRVILDVEPGAIQKFDELSSIDSTVLVSQLKDFVIDEGSPA